MPSLALACRLSAVSRASRRSFSPASLFSSGEQGVWYDPSDLSTLFQDAAGTIPVTAVEQPVGLMLDKSKGLVLGSNQAPTGTVSDFVTTGTATIVGTTFNIPATNDEIRANAGSETAGRWYVMEWVVSGVAGQTVNIGIRNWVIGVETVAVFTLTGGQQTIRLYRIASANGTIRTRIQKTPVTSATSVTFYSYSVRELPGNHAYQSTTTSRPTLSARYNLLTKTENFSDSYWFKSSSTTPDANTLRDAVGSGFHFVSNGTSASFTSGVSYKAQVRIEKGTIGYGGIHINDGTAKGCSIDLTTGQLGTPYGGATATAVADGAGWILTITATAGTTTSTGQIAIFMSSSNTLAPYTGTGNGTIKISKADLRVANDGIGLPAYQRVNTATDYDYAGFPPYLKFDGTDDSMVTNSIDFSATDKMTVFAGVRKLSDAVDGCVLESSTNFAVNSGSIAVFAPGGTPPVATKYFFGTAGTSFAQLQPTGFAAPITNVLTGTGNISGDSAILRINGAQVASDTTTDQGTGNYGNYPLYIGSRAGTSLRYNGHLYSLVVCGKLASAAEITATEAYINQKTRAY